MEAPDYVICLDCETPCYVFEWQEGKVTEAFCETCGADEVDGFATEEDFEGMVAAYENKR